MKLTTYNKAMGRTPIHSTRLLPSGPVKPSPPGDPSQPPVDRVRVVNPNVLSAAAHGLYTGTLLPLIGSALASATSTPAQLATCLVGGAALGGLLGGGIEALGRYRDPLSGWLRGAGMVGTALTLGSLAGPASVAVGIPLTAGISYVTSNRHGAKQVKSAPLRALGWMALAATNVAFPVLLYRAVGGGLPVAIAGMLSAVSTMMVLDPDS